MSIIRLAALLVLAAGLSGCPGAIRPESPEEELRMTTDFQNGTVIFDCTIKCSGSYIFNQDQIWAFHDNKAWHELAIAVISAGWRQDISYFLLGVAAQQLGYYEPADRYYRMAGALSQSPLGSERCGSVPSLCHSIVLPRDLYPRLAAVSRAMRQPRASAPLPAIDRSAQPRMQGPAGANPSATYSVYRTNQTATQATPAVANADYRLCRTFSAGVKLANGEPLEKKTCRDANGNWSDE
ncbi:MAG: hypothetical protein WDO56_13650 [Gammaproteobacteria bacterium]